MAQTPKLPEPRSRAAGRAPRLDPPREAHDSALVNDGVVTARGTRDPTVVAGSRALSLFGIAILFAAAVALRFAFLDVSARTPDERFYASYGARIAKEGPCATASAVSEFVRDPARPYPWPTRPGYLWLAGGVMRVSGDATPRALAGLSTAASVLSLALLAALAFRFLGAGTAAFAILLIAASPLDLAMARRGWQDTPVALLTLGMISCVLWSASRPRRLLPALAFFALSAFALTVKESAAIPFALGTLALAIGAGQRGRGARGAIAVLAAGAVTAAAAAAALVVASGGAEMLRRALELGRLVNSPNAYMREYQTGSPAYYLAGLALLHPLPFALGTVAAILAVFRAPFLLAPWNRPGARLALVMLGWFVLIFGAVACAWPQKNLRFLSPIVAPIAMLAAALLASALSWAGARVSPRTAKLAGVALALALTAGAALDLQRFVHDFVVLRIPDLATPWFVRAAGLRW